MNNQDNEPMTSNRPYLLRAIYDWITDNNLTPYVLVDATQQGVRVPPQVIKNSQVVLNLAMRAVGNLDLGNEWISFQARFSGVSQSILIPVSAVLALYAQENGQGMMFPAEESGQPGSKPAVAPLAAVDDDQTAPAEEPAEKESAGRGLADKSPAGKNPDKPRKGAPHLRVIK